MKKQLYLLIYIIAINNITFAQVLITPDNQGIGTSLPYSTSKLTLDGKGLTNEVLSLRSDASPNIYFYTPMVPSFANRAAYIGPNITEDGSFFDVGTYTNSGLGLNLISNGNKRLHINPLGKVGIGFNPISPNAALNIFVTDNATEALRLTSSTNEVNPAGPYMTFYKDNIRRASISSGNKLSDTGHSLDIISDDELALMTYSNSTLHTLFHGLPNGNVGIPFASPNYKFNVSGTVNFNSQIYIKGNTGALGQTLRSGGPTGDPFWGSDSSPFVSATSPNTSYTHSIEHYINYSSENIDFEGLLNGGIVTVKEKGIYQVYIEIPVLSNNSNNQVFELRIYKNAEITPIYTEFVSNRLYGFVNGTGTPVYGAVARYKFTFQDMFWLLANESLHFKVYHVDSVTPVTFTSKINVSLLKRG